jgi:uncharacterized protein
MTQCNRDPRRAIYDYVLPAGESWFYQIKAGQVFRFVDMEGNQAVDTLFYLTEDPEERYSPSETMLRNGNLYLGTGTRLYGTSGKLLLTILDDTCGRHDTLGGACAQESNTVRYAHEKRSMHACRESYLLALGKAGDPWNRRDLGPNINFFMNVPVTSEGGLTFADGVSGPGRYVELRAEAGVTVLISNCPQLNNPCNAYNPTPARILIWES